MYENLLAFCKSQKRVPQVSTVAHLKGTLSTVTKQRGRVLYPIQFLV
jgi:hypothetical protein